MIPNATKRKLLDGEIDLTNDTVKVALLKATTEYSPDPDSHEFVSDILDGGTTGEEFDDTNYSRLTLANQAVSQDDADDEGVFDADDLTFPDLGSSTGGQTIEAVLLYKQVGADDTTPEDDPVIRVIDDNESDQLEQQTNGGDINLSWATEGIVNLQ